MPDTCGPTRDRDDPGSRAAPEAAAKMAWQDRLPHLRARLLCRIADGSEINCDVLARLQMIQRGKRWRECQAQATSAGMHEQ